MRAGLGISEQAEGAIYFMYCHIRDAAIAAVLIYSHNLWLKLKDFHLSFHGGHINTFHLRRGFHRHSSIARAITPELASRARTRWINYELNMEIGLIVA